jgi:hypothetical protein
VQDSGLQQAENLKKFAATSPDVPIQTCYTDVESNGRDASYQKTQTGCQMCDLKARDTHARADDGLSAPMLKVSPARFDIHLYRLDNAHPRIVELLMGPQGPGAQYHTQSFNVQDSAFNKPKLQNLRPPLLDVPISKFDLIPVGAMVETPHTKPKPLPNVRPSEGDTHVCADDGLSAMLPKCRQHGLTYSSLQFGQ